MGIFGWFYGWLVNPPLRVWWGLVGWVWLGVWGGVGRVYGVLLLVLWLVGEPALTGLVGVSGLGLVGGVGWGGAGLWRFFVGFMVGWLTRPYGSWGGWWVGVGRVYGDFSLVLWLVG
jgi:hypothetical protein